MILSDLPKDGRGKNWEIIIYEDSCPDWRAVLRALRLKALVSPLHDSDVTAKCENKKPHRHCIIFFSSKKSEKQVQEISDEFSGVKVLVRECLIRDIRGAVRYLVHYENPDKAQYDVGGIESFGGADVLEYFTDACDVDQSVGEMMQWLDNDRYASFSRLARFARDNRPDWFRTITTKRTLFLKSYASSVSYERRMERMDSIFGDSESDEPRCCVCGRPAFDFRVNHRGGHSWFCSDHERTVVKMIDDNLRFVFGPELDCDS